MSALRWKASMFSVGIDVREVPEADGAPFRVDVRFITLGEVRECMTRGGSTNTADSFEDQAIDDAANRALLCEVGTDQAVLGSAPCTIQFSALHPAGLP